MWPEGGEDGSVLARRRLQSSAPSLTLIVETPDGPYIRVVASASPLAPDVDQGAAAETATGSAAARWGLPDFVLRPALRRTGSAVREIGDVLLVHGDQGVVVQVKSRANPTAEPARESGWIQKAVNKAVRQASGTVRALRLAPVALKNLRGREVRIAGETLEWLAVVIIDHAGPPEGFTPATPEGKLPTVVLLRRDWEFLFDQLRSTHAVIQYLHRVAPLDPVPLAEEPVRYYQLAQADEDKPPDRLNPAILGEGGQEVSTPLLPKAPAGHEDTRAHLFLRMVLEDVATAPITDGDEKDRLAVLAEVDELPVGMRAELGRKLLWMLEHVSETGADQTSWAFRRHRFNPGAPHLMFGACSSYNEMTREAFRQWVMLRHYEFGEDLGSAVNLTSIGVLLTPRKDGVRPWDTTMLRISGPIDLGQDELESMRRPWT